MRVVLGESGEAQQAAGATAQRNLIVLVVVGVVAAIAIAWWITREVTVPVREMKGLLSKAVGGDLTGRAKHTARDEFGEIARDYNRMVESLSEVLATIALDGTDLSAATEELTISSAQISASAGASAEQASIVAAAAEQVSDNVRTVAAATEEMSVSIREISKNTSDAAQVATTAVDLLHTANTTMSQLEASSAEISAVIKVISSIAAQTNLLALNASIEAARAGDAGKGFAVVASEVKDLARATSTATADIARKVENIQGDARAAVAAIGRISEIIEQISDTQSTISSAVEEQTATTNEMSRNVADAATGVAGIASSATGVALASAATSQGVTEARSSTAELSRMSTHLSALLARFTMLRQQDESSDPTSSYQARRSPRA
ncbi:MAG: methyl-accepting chemotaxis protein [Cellulomonas sp.]